MAMLDLMRSSPSWSWPSDISAHCSSSDSDSHSSSSSPSPSPSSPSSSYSNSSNPPPDDEDLLDDLSFAPVTTSITYPRPPSPEPPGDTYLALQLRVATETDAIIAHFLQALYQLCVPVSSTDVCLVDFAFKLREARGPKEQEEKEMMAMAFEVAIVGRELLEAYDRLSLERKDMERDLGEKEVWGFCLNE